MVFTGQSRTTRYGFDFSKNLTTNLEMHGEFAVVNNLDTMAINANGQTTKTQADATSQLIGLRYLSEKETTYFLEYYHNGGGFSRTQIKDFITFVDNSYPTLSIPATTADSRARRHCSTGPMASPIRRATIYIFAPAKRSLSISSISLPQSHPL